MENFANLLATDKELNTKYDFNYNCGIVNGNTPVTVSNEYHCSTNSVPRAYFKCVGREMDSSFQDKLFKMIRGVWKRKVKSGMSF